MQENSKNNMNEEDDVINLAELFMEYVRYWYIIFVSAALVGVMAFLICRFLITPKYESTSALYVLSKSTSVTSLADIQLGSNLTNDYMVVVGSRPIIDQVIENLGLDETYKSLFSRITLENPTNTRILKITVRDSDPNMAKLIADEIADLSAQFISQKMDQDPPSILQYGYADEGKVSPSTFKYTILGAFLGAFLVMAIITIMYLCNDTINDPEDIENKLGINLLGTIPLEKKPVITKIKSGHKASSRKSKGE